MIKYFLPIVIVLSFGSAVSAQSISGYLSNLLEQEIRLEGYSGFETYPISSAITDNNGKFELNYSQSDVGAGYLISEDENPFLVILSGEDIVIQGEALSVPESISILKGEENQWFEQYASEHPRREQALSAWNYLENIYTADSLFAVQEIPKQAIQNEIERINSEDSTFIANLPEESYVRWYLPLRKLVSSVSVVAKHRTEEIPGAISAFRDLDYTDSRLYKSGLLGDVIESHVWLIENSGRSLDSVFVELNNSIDILIEQLVPESELLNEIMEYLFELQEQRSLFTSAEHLALSLLENHSELLSTPLASKLEIYRTMKPGSTAPDIRFPENTSFPDGINAQHLSDLESDYTLVIFAAGRSRESQQMMADLTESYKEWQKEGVEVVLVSLDETPEVFKVLTSDLPFIYTTDFKQWESPIVQEWHIHSLPAMVLLNSELEILIHPNSVTHMGSWVDWYLVRGNL